MEQNPAKIKLGRVIAQYRGKYRVSSENEEFWAEVIGKIIYTAETQLNFPVVGDLVNIIDIGHGNAVIKDILPRKSIFERKAAGKDSAQPIAANVDTAFIVEAVDQDFNLNRFERYMVIILNAKIEPVLILNKIDLIPPTELKEKITLIKDRFGDTPLLSTSIFSENGIDDLKQSIKDGRIYCFLGSSGVGKSSLINKLLGQELIKTKEISLQTKKGQHTTTHRELFVLNNGGMVIDNPGMREVGMANAVEGVKSVFYEIERLGKACRFADCTHQHEPGCAVLEAVQTGALSKEKYGNYNKLKKEAAHYAMTSAEKKEKDRSLGRVIKDYHKMFDKKGK